MSVHLAVYDPILQGSASEVDRKGRVPRLVEYRVFKKYFADLSECIQNPATLAGRLYSADLLSRDTKRTIYLLERPAQQITELLDAVEGQIRLDPQNFYKFVDVLEKDRPMQHLCDKLRSTCGECDNVCQSTSTDQWCSGVAQLKSTQPVSPAPRGIFTSLHSHPSTAGNDTVSYY